MDWIVAFAVGLWAGGTVVAVGLGLLHEADRADWERHYQEVVDWAIRTAYAAGRAGWAGPDPVRQIEQEAQFRVLLNGRTGH